MINSLYNIKNAEKSDFSALDSFYRKYSTGGMARFTLQKWLEGKDPEGQPIFALDLDNDKIISAGYVRVCSKKFALLISWLVHPDWRQKGVASAMDKFAFDYIKPRGIDRVILTVDIKNERSLKRLYHLRDAKRINLKRIGSVFFIHAQNNDLKFSEHSTNVRYATIEDEFESWWFSRLSLNYYFSHGIYSEDRNLHYLDREHFKKLISEKRVIVSKNGNWIFGLAIMNSDSILVDQDQRRVTEIGFSCGNIEPIVKFVSENNEPKTILRTCVYSEKDIKKFIKLGFLTHYDFTPELDMKSLKIFSYTSN